ncbi:hypothetical protein RGF97_16965 [Streptomyces roseicoloratus]|uniref:Uncharacterized protein n=1 Tax=Streptomyces roseicoloratus TaxID=2508722 RepID=A0ABY9S7E9_9ACTN|nr:hypothetical protein [Streptomyces roseicoloratus]WMX48915.1 hypothetical protein RGF97_16965 [Streptomyces roseicoloratus]
MGHVTVYDVARALPGIGELRDHCRGLAMLDAVLSPEWDGRYYSFDAHWGDGDVDGDGDGDGEALASMRNGSGDEYAVVFSASGAYVRGFDHESPMSPWARRDDPEPWPGVLDSVPDAFRPYVTEPAFCEEDGVPTVTCCLWREPSDPVWRTGTVDFPTGGDADGDADGAGHLFELLVDRSAEAYAAWASYYYETEVDVRAVRHVLALEPLTSEVVAALNPDASLADLARDIAGIGYPSPGDVVDCLEA